MKSFVFLFKQNGQFPKKIYLGEFWQKRKLESYKLQRFQLSNLLFQEDIISFPERFPASNYQDR